jgi:hypothetical protein
MAKARPACPGIGGAQCLILCWAMALLIRRDPAGRRAESRLARRRRHGMVLGGARLCGAGRVGEGEGDRRSPPGFFPVGKTFGFSHPTFTSRLAIIAYCSGRTKIFREQLQHGLARGEKPA